MTREFGHTTQSGEIGGDDHKMAVVSVSILMRSGKAYNFQGPQAATLHKQVETGVLSERDGLLITEHEGHTLMIRVDAVDTVRMR